MARMKDDGGENILRYDDDAKQETAMGLLTRVVNIKSVLLECMQADQRVRAILFGEGEEESLGKASPIAESVDGITHDTLALICNLRGNLDRTVASLAGRKPPTIRKVAHG